MLWHSKTGAVRNAASASIVVPSRFKPEGENQPHTVPFGAKLNVELFWRSNPPRHIGS